jgi:hypothetical protein
MLRRTGGVRKCRIPRRREDAKKYKDRDNEKSDPQISADSNADLRKSAQSADLLFLDFFAASRLRGSISRNGLMPVDRLAEDLLNLF